MAAVAAALADYAGQLSKNTSRTVAGVAQLFTMYVVPAKTFVEMAALKPFEVLLQEGVLVAFDDQEGHALFVSHQWLTSGHPDPKMEQLKIIQDALKNILAGVSTVPASLGLEFLEGRGGAAVGGEMCGRPLFVWYDYLCCPQAEGKREEAILSLPAYVEKCRFFSILCPPVQNSSGETLSKETYEGRAWCRLEQACRMLTLQEDASEIIEIQGPQEQAIVPASTWMRSPVGEGDLSNQDDRPLMGQVLQQMVRDKMTAFLMKGNFHKYRLIFALLHAHFAGLPKKPVENLVPGFVSKATDPADFFLAEYMHQNGFSSVTDRDAEGPMILQALEHQADPNDAISQPSAFCHFASGTSGLQMCSFLGRNEALRQLIAHRADVTAVNGSGATALHWAAAGDNVEGIQILRTAGAGEGASDSLGCLAFEAACAAGSLDAIQELLHRVPAPLLTEGLQAGLLHGGASPEVVTTLVRARADVNAQRSIPLFSSMGLWYALLSWRHWWSPSPLSNYAYHHSGATPLMCSILTSSFQATAVLLAAGAKADIRNYRGKNAEELALEMSAPDHVLSALRSARESG
eukprot:s1807_g2.t3